MSCFGDAKTPGKLSLMLTVTWSCHHWESQTTEEND